MQIDDHAGLHRARRARRAPAEICQNNFAGLRERIARIEAGEGDRNLAGDSGSIPCHRFPWCRTRVLGFQQEIVSKFLSTATRGKFCSEFVTGTTAEHLSVFRSDYQCLPSRSE